MWPAYCVTYQNVVTRLTSNWTMTNVTCDACEFDDVFDQHDPLHWPMEQLSHNPRDPSECGDLLDPLTHWISDPCETPVIRQNLETYLTHMTLQPIDLLYNWFLWLMWPIRIWPISPIWPTDPCVPCNSCDPSQFDPLCTDPVHCASVCRWPTCQTERRQWSWVTLVLLPRWPASYMT